MTQHTYLASLDAKHKELTQALASRESIKIEGRAADPLDEALASSARVVAVDGINRNMALLTLVKNAIRKILSTGSFGECEQCGDEISEARLKLVPWAPLCIHCQTESEQKGRK